MHKLLLAVAVVCSMVGCWNKGAHPKNANAQNPGPLADPQPPQREPWDTGKDKVQSNK